MFPSAMRWPASRTIRIITPHHGEGKIMNFTKSYCKLLESVIIKVIHLSYIALLNVATVAWCRQVYLYVCVFMGESGTNKPRAIANAENRIYLVVAIYKKVCVVPIY